MALDINDTYANSTPADTSYPYGSAKNETSGGALDGTPWEKAGFDDLYGLMQSLLAGAGTVPNGNPDTVLAPQYLASIFNLRWYNKVDFVVGSKVVGSNGVTYVCKQANGPASTVQDPVTEGSPRAKWLTEASSMFDLLNPVGALYFSHASNSPADLYGVGTWLRIKGRFIAGLDEADTDFNTPGETGGTKTHNHNSTFAVANHTLTIDQIPPHTHNITRVLSGGAVDGSFQSVIDGDSDPAVGTTTSTGGGSGHGHNISGAVSNKELLPPYQVAYIWRRTA